jgi:hypothetical protein
MPVQLQLRTLDTCQSSRLAVWSIHTVTMRNLQLACLARVAGYDTTAAAAQSDCDRVDKRSPAVCLQLLPLPLPLLLLLQLLC